MCFQAFLEDLSLPFLKWQLPRLDSDPVPQALHVVDLLLDGQLVKPRRR